MRQMGCVASLRGVYRRLIGTPALDIGRPSFFRVSTRFERMLMLLTLMKAKLHRATVTQANMDYEGSISIDSALLAAAGILPHEQVDVLNITTGARFTTYAIEAPASSRTIGVNGAAARLVQPGDQVIIVAYGQLSEDEARRHVPTVILLDGGNHIKRAA